jgi:hypothetical protein
MKEPTMSLRIEHEDILTTIERLILQKNFEAAE